MAKEKKEDEKKQDKQLKIALCMPVSGRVDSNVAISLINSLKDARQKYLINSYFVVDQPLSSARNFLVNMFLKSDAEYLWFLDSDMVLPENVLDKLLAHDKDVVSAMYYGRKFGFPVMKKSGTFEPWIEDYPKNKLIEVGAMGTGCMLIKRHVLEKLSKLNEPVFKLKQLDNNTIIGEDVYFCQLLTQNNFKVYVDTGLVAGHFGGVVVQEYGSKLKELNIFGRDYSG